MLETVLHQASRRPSARSRGMSEDEILRDFPDLTREDIRACLAFAADRERKFVSVPPA